MATVECILHKICCQIRHQFKIKKQLLKRVCINWVNLEWFKYSKRSYKTMFWNSYAERVRVRVLLGPLHLDSEWLVQSIQRLG